MLILLLTQRDGKLDLHALQEFLSSIKAQAKAQFSKNASSHACGGCELCSLRMSTQYGAAVERDMANSLENSL